MMEADVPLAKILPQRQLVMHSPPEGRFGDCYRTAVAIVLGRKANTVPHVCERGPKNSKDVDGLIAMRKWLRSEGYSISKAVFNGDLSWAQFRNWMKQFNPDSAIIVTGDTGRGINHCVVMIGGKVVCDPLTGTADQNALTGPAKVDGECYWWVEVIAPLYDASASA